MTAEIRPRSDWEAVDLGFAMARREFWRCLLVWWLAVLLPTLVGIALLRNHPWLFLILFWWWKPAASRLVLFELSRRLFGERPPWKQVWPQIPRVWWRRFGYRFLLARFSPWGPVTMPVEDLEGLRGDAYRQRSRLLLRRGEGAAVRLSMGGSVVAVWLSLGLLGLTQMLLPQGQDGVYNQASEAIQAGDWSWMPLSSCWLVAGCYMLAISLCDVFVVGGGFGVYVNSRTWIEGWDVELAFKRMANRIGSLAAILLAGLCWFGPAPIRAAEKPPAEQIREIKADPAFEVQKVKVRDPSSKSSSSSSSSRSPAGSLPAWLDSLAGGFGMLLLGICLAALIAGIVWLLWKFRHLFEGTGGSGGGGPRPVARVVMGMEVSRDSLPEDVPTAAWRLWNEGRRHEALALLYRGAISRVIETGRVEIAEADTEGDCLRRVRAAGDPARPDYFQSLTAVWIGLAYARTLPGDAEVDSLCRNWPYVERRTA
ncbi:hypothetical protein KBB96_01760 [Luteolibacter ambystomatis]|uniref:DUF4129 domain-containing protein n=1 Tax=Luteolibacter ambystomatis TaxID=2824561 RepID=A0A975J093_9BACT|nr:hypothetical protein [Luteolibacter ambystomatis]QUE51631.1 hypothetical protein KBB96_01760 [Luteolibacter ambystomatis]